MSKAKTKRIAAVSDEIKSQPFKGLVAKLPVSEPSHQSDLAQPVNSSAAEPSWKSQRIILQREKKGRGGKTVIRVKGVNLSVTELKTLLKLLKSDLGCGGTLDSGELLILGDVSDRLARWFEKQGALRVARGN